jgi:hypothetical protein
MFALEGEGKGRTFVWLLMERRRAVNVSILGITVINLSDLVPSPLREKVRMRGNLKAICHCDSPHPPALSRWRGSFLP